MWSRSIKLVPTLTCPDKMDQLRAFLSHQGLSPAVQVLGGRLVGLDGQSGDPSDRVGWAELNWQGCRLRTGQVAHLTHSGWGVVQVGAELAHPLGGRQEGAGTVCPE